MAIWQLFKVSRKTFFDPKAWLNLDFFQYGNTLIWGVLRDLTTTPPAQREETFKNAIQRLGLTIADVDRMERYYWTIALCFAVLGVLCVVFSFYLLFYHTFHGWLIGIAASSILFAEAFRYHFWSFQIKHRKLGCTFDEWLHGKIKEEEKGV